MSVPADITEADAWIPDWRSWHTHDVSEAEDIGGQVYYPQRLVAFDAARLDFTISSMSLGPLVLGEMSYGTEIRLACSALDTGYQVNLSRSGYVDARNGTQTSVIAPGRAAVFNPSGVTELRRWSSDAHVIGLKIDRSYLQHQTAVLLGEEAPAVHFSMPLVEGAPDNRALVGAIEYAVELLRKPPSPVLAGLVGPRLAEIVTHALLMSQESNLSEALLDRSASRGAHSPRHVTRVQEAIIADPGHPWTAEELARTAGTCLRTLQGSFRATTGETVFQFLREVRLDAARAALRADAGTSVALVAHTYGFGHLGRFAEYYRTRFGELPTQTLRTAHGIPLSRPS